MYIRERENNKIQPGNNKGIFLINYRNVNQVSMGTSNKLCMKHPDLRQGRNKCWVEKI